ncbi:MAG: tyrosine-type recombinase/integrase [Anaerolineae bacterium]|nr:tyrosine-type recombinase/integrase [Anaerolineae bacterium]
MLHNSVHSAISFQNGTIRINLDELNCSKIELMKNKIVQTIEYSNGNGLNSVVLTLEELTSLREGFLDYIEVDKNLKDTSITGYKTRTRLFIQWLEENCIQNVSMQHWRDYYAYLKRSELTDTTVRNYFRDLNGFAIWLVQTGRLPSNPLTGIIPPSASKKSVQSKAIPREDINIMIEHAQNVRDRAIFIFFRDTACRGSEAAAMLWENVDLDAGKAYVIGKGSKPRTLRFKPVTKQVLVEYQETLKEEQKTGPVWWGKQGALTYSGIYQIFRRVARRASLQNKKFNPHAWRHAFGRDATQAGMPTIILQKVLGHESITTTEIYADPDEEAVHQAHYQYSPMNEIDLGRAS